MEKSNKTERKERNVENEYLHGKRPHLATTSFVVDQMDRDSMSSKNESHGSGLENDEIEEKDQTEEQGGQSDAMYLGAACQSPDSVVNLSAVEDTVTVIDNLANEHLSWTNLFNWDDFGYSLILSFAPTTWDVFSDLSIADQLEEEDKNDKDYEAGLSYLFVCLPGLYMLNETMSEVLSDRNSALVHIINLYTSVVFSSAMIVVFWMDPLLFRWPATGLNKCGVSS